MKGAARAGLMKTKRPRFKMRVLIVGDVNIIFTYEFITKVLNRIEDVQVDILNFAPLQEKNRTRAEQLQSIGCQVFFQPRYKILRKIRFLHPVIRVLEAIRYLKARKYDVVDIHFPGVDSWIIPYVIKRKTRLVTSIYGSDLLRASKHTFRVLKLLFKRSDCITAASSFVENVISKKTAGEFDHKIRIAKYGSEACEDMHHRLSDLSRESCKKAFGIPAEKISILCGYNASEAQRHIDIINECGKLPEEYRSRIHLVFHCSYGGTEAYIRKIESSLLDTGMPYTLIREYLRGEKLAQLRKAADVFLNVQPTDVLSASMIEELEAGAVCMIGKWLHYPDLEEYGARMIGIDDLSRLHEQLPAVIDHFDQFQLDAEKNRGVWSILSWEKDFEKWKRIICGSANRQ